MPEKNMLKDLEMLKKVSIETLDEMWNRGAIKKVSRGTIFMRAKEPEDSVLFQIKGKSMLYNLTHAGKRKIIFVAGPGSLLSEHVLETRDASVYCEALESGSVFAISNKDFKKLMKKDFALTEAVLAAQEKKIWRLEHQLKNTMGSIYMERKLAAKLWKLARDFGKKTSEGIEIDFPVSVTFLADMLGAPRETASRICKMLLDYGLIKIDKKRITIINPSKISHFYKTGEI